jgi:hypothetical protein
LPTVADFQEDQEDQARLKKALLEDHEDVWTSTGDESDDDSLTNDDEESSRALLPPRLSRAESSTAISIARREMLEDRRRKDDFFESFSMEPKMPSRFKAGRRTTLTKKPRRATSVPSSLYADV